MKIGRIILGGAPDAETDKFGADTERILASIFEEPSQFILRTVPAEVDQIRAALVELCDEEKCPVVVTSGGTGLGPRDLIPDATLRVIEKELPGFGEIMRYYSFERRRVAALSRATAGVRGRSLVINLPARPKAVKFCLHLLREPIVEALEHITGTRYTLFVDPITVPIDKYLPFLKRFRPKPDPRGEKHPYIA